MPRPRGDRRAQRPARHQGMVDVRVAPQAGIPGRMQPRRGPRSDAPDFGPVLTDPRAQGQRPSGRPFLVAARALSRAAHLPKRAATNRTGSPRVPATGHAAHAVVAPAAPPTMPPLPEASRDPGGRASSGGLAHGGGLLSAAPRQAPAQRTVARQGRQQRDQEGHAGRTLGRTAFAGAAEAPQARARWTAGWQPTWLHPSAVWPTPPERKRGRPSLGAPPEPRVDHRGGA